MSMTRNRLPNLRINANDNPGLRAPPLMYYRPCDVSFASSSAIHVSSKDYNCNCLFCIVLNYAMIEIVLLP